MSSKKFRGKPCVYCGAVAVPSTTADHVFAREFFLPDTPYSPVKVPACLHCNGEKSHLEHYLTAVLPFGGRHEDAAANLALMVPKRLARNVRLHNMLARHTHASWVKENGELWTPAMTLPINFTHVEHLFRFIVRALVFHHFGVLLNDDTFVMALALSKVGQDYFDKKFFSGNVACRVLEDVGRGTFIYEGVQASDNRSITAWRFAIYGGLTLGGDAGMPDEGSSMIGVITGPKRAWHMASLRARFGPSL